MSTKKEPWVEDFEAQISLSENIWKSDIVGKGRIALVLLDNVIEFMSKAYLKIGRDLVGKRKRHKITPDAWHDITMNFADLMDAMRQHSPLVSTTIDSIEKNHRIRNELYHTSAPTEVRMPMYQKALENAIEVIDVLFGVSFKSKVIDLGTLSYGKQEFNRIIQKIGKEDRIRVELQGRWSLAQWVRVTIYGYATKLGKNPDIEQIIMSLRISHQNPSRETLLQCLRNLKNGNQVSKTDDGSYILEQKGLDMMHKAKELS